MTTVIMRSALEPGGLLYRGKLPPPELHSIVRDHRGERVVTWGDVMRERRGRQEFSLRNKRRIDPWRTAKIDVRYYDQNLFGGWQAMIYTIREHHWIDRDRRGLIPRLVALFPLVLAFDDQSWEQWKIAFAGQFWHGTHHRKPRGRAYVWWNGRDGLRRTE